MIEGLSMLCREIDGTELIMAQPQTELADWHAGYFHLRRGVTDARGAQGALRGVQLGYVRVARCIMRCMYVYRTTELGIPAGGASC